MKGGGCMVGGLAHGLMAYMLSSSDVEPFSLRQARTIHLQTDQRGDLHTDHGYSRYLLIYLHALTTQ